MPSGAISTFIRPSVPIIAMPPRPAKIPTAKRPKTKSNLLRKMRPDHDERSLRISGKRWLADDPDPGVFGRRAGLFYGTPLGAATRKDRAGPLCPGAAGDAR